MMERTWSRENFQYEENTASWHLKEEWQLADVAIKCNILSVAFRNGIVDWTIVNDFMNFLQKRKLQIREDVHWAGRIISAMGEANAEVVPPQDKLQLAGVTLKRYSESGYSFTYDYLLSATTSGETFYWTVRLKDYSIAGVTESEIYI
ncbi:hypothetical protein [Chitinophaga sp. CF418]|uniref:hypothetical protein n=1 Tax=Chitinophaga sp. CF418 TaxID=1855287 RepID=UPI00091A63E1|nr:hypothetical protein [Chitinophaga sp. CF418]SHM83334.1 hypothetical protein SAMN05216311_103396 [Chitinophaga sp. CF418]